jgi:hypothetical protein
MLKFDPSSFVHNHFGDGPTPEEEAYIEDAPHVCTNHYLCKLFEIGIRPFFLLLLFLF